MAGTVVTASPVPTAPPKVAACPRCNVVLLPIQVKLPGSGGRFIGGLLIFFGIIGLFGYPIVGLVLIGLGIVVMSLGGKQPGLMCPNCGTQAATLSDLARTVTAPPPRSETSRLADNVIRVIAVVLVAIGVGAVYVVNRHNDAAQPGVVRPGTAEPAERQSALPPLQIVVTRTSRDRYRAEDGTVIITAACSEPANNNSAMLRYDPHATDTDDKITFASGRSCKVDLVIK